MVGDIYLQLTSQINKENILVQNKLKIIEPLANSNITNSLVYPHSNF